MCEGVGVCEGVRVCEGVCEGVGVSPPLRSSRRRSASAGWKPRVMAVDGGLGGQSDIIREGHQ